MRGHLSGTLVLSQVTLYTRAQVSPQEVGMPRVGTPSSQRCRQSPNHFDPCSCNLQDALLPWKIFVAPMTWMRQSAGVYYSSTGLVPNQSARETSSFRGSCRLTRKARYIEWSSRQHTFSRCMARNPRHMTERRPSTST